MVVLFACIGLLALFGPKLRLKHNLQQKHVSLSNKINLTEGYISNLRKREKDLNTNPHYLEKLARDKLGYSATDEIIYKFK